MKIGIVGCGEISLVHANVIESINNSHLVAVADININKAYDLVNRLHLKDCKTYSSLEEMIKEEELDIIHICTPHDLHVPMALYAMEHGVHVFMEKPPAISRKQFKLLETASNNMYLGFCFQNRYNESVKTVKKILEDPATGTIIGARAFVTWNRSKEYYTQNDWKGTWMQEGGSALINQAIHTLDLLVQFLGKPRYVDATMTNHRLKNIIETEDTLEAYMELEKGDVCFYATTACTYDAPVFIEINCENVIVRLEGDEVTQIYPDGRKENINLYKDNIIGKDYWGSGHQSCIEDFYKCIETKERFPVGLEEIKDTFFLTMDIYNSSKEKNPDLFKSPVKISGFADEIDADFDKQITVLKECGMSFMELRSAYGKNISEYTLEEATLLKNKLDENKIKVSAIGSPIGKISATDDFEAHYKLFCHVVSLAKLFETKYIRIFSFYIPEGEKAESYKDVVFERLDKMISYAKEQDIILLHENEKGIYGDTKERCAEIMEELYCYNFNAIFDFANFVQCDQDVMETFKVMKPYVNYIHVKDAHKHNHQVVPAGLGDGSISEIIDILKSEEYNGFYSLEPHLTEFVGFMQLEGENQNENLTMDAADGRSAFLIAHKAFIKIIFP